MKLQEGAHGEKLETEIKKEERRRFDDAVREALQITRLRVRVPWIVDDAAK